MLSSVCWKMELFVSLLESMRAVSLGCSSKAFGPFYFFAGGELIVIVFGLAPVLMIEGLLLGLFAGELALLDFPPDST